MSENSEVAAVEVEPRVINVLRPFRLSIKPEPTSRLPKEIHFEKGLVELSGDLAALADHPYLNAPHYADGHIESPEAAQMRLQKLTEERAAQDKRNERLRVQAEASARRVANMTNAAVSSNSDLEKALNTPSNELRAQLGVPEVAVGSKPGKPLTVKGTPAPQPKK